ncbi:MAG: PqqD family protein [Clostridia bacterium]|nr:PqqD family protein [Clostridia bacterium]
MRINPDYVMREIAGDFVLVPTGDALSKYNGLFAVTEVGAKIFELIPVCSDADEIASKIVEEYEVDKDTAKSDVDEFLSTLEEKGILLK